MPKDQETEDAVIERLIANLSRHERDATLAMRRSIGHRKDRDAPMTLAAKHILLVEDEPHLAFNIELNLRAEGFQTTVAKDGLEAIDCYRTKGPFALIILDVMMPGMNGFEVAVKIREIDKKTGILMLTARASENDIIQGLESGADDYMTKPFSLHELLLRVKRMADRSEFYDQSLLPDLSSLELYHFDANVWNPHTFELHTRQGHFILTALEAKVLGEFLSHPNQILSRKHLLSQVWGVSGNVETRTVDNFVMRLRKFLEADPSKPHVLQSIRGRGYKLCASVTKEKPNGT